MLNFITTASNKRVIPIVPVITNKFSDWYQQQNLRLKNWLNANDFNAKPSSICLFPDREGKLEQVLLGIENVDDFWVLGALPNKLPAGNYQIQGDWSAAHIQRMAIAWGLGCYKFTIYKKSPTPKAKLLIPEFCDIQYIENIVDAIYLIRDLINYPAENMGPASLAKAANSIAIEFDAKLNQIIGDDLLKKGYGAIHAVGRGSSCLPRLLDLTWGKKKENPNLVLVGKGVCFDSGGLDIKPREAMRNMNKDMGGAAHVLGLAKLIMTRQLPVNLRVIIPAVENMVSGSSYKPDDIITTYNGTTVAVNDTDAEGRLILADCLALASDAKPDLIIDFATLTGAARVALGTEISAMFTADKKIAQKILDFAEAENDPIWQMPLYKPYRELLASNVADLGNVSESRWGGAVTAALFLQEFVGKDISWVHFDLPDCNEKDKPGRPKGGEAHGLRAVYHYLVERYGQ